MAADLVTVVDSDVELIRDYHTHSCFGATFEGNDVSPLQARAPSLAPWSRRVAHTH